MQPSKRPSSRQKPRHSGQSRFLNQRNVVIGFVIVAALMVIAIVVRISNRPDIAAVDGPDPTNTELVALGRQLYVPRCAGCHGAQLEGQPGWPEPLPNGTRPATPLDASGTAPQRTDQWLFTTIKQGGQATAPPGQTSTMPAFGGSMSDEQIWAVISYIQSTWPQDVRDAQP